MSEFCFAPRSATSGEGAGYLMGVATRHDRGGARELVILDAERPDAGPDGHRAPAGAHRRAGARLVGAGVAAAEGTSLTDPKFFRTAKDFRRWLEAHASREPELVVGFYKVDSGRPCMSWSESVDQALCFGWIDGVRKSIDDESYLIRFTCRKPSSIWSAINIRKYQDLDGKGRVAAAGRAAYNKRKTAKSVVYSYEQVKSPGSRQGKSNPSGA